MKIRTTQEAEIERVETKGTWELYQGTSMVKAIKKARELGWKDNKVQVRVEKRGDIHKFYVEPYEEGCGCQGILKYSPFYERI